MSQPRMVPIAVLNLALVLILTGPAIGKVVWQVKPEPIQFVNENQSIQLNCQFKEVPATNSSNYYVIWYKDGASSNVLSLNDKLANPNATRYEINGKYNFVIHNATQKDSGVYTCQLFQSNELVASVRLTVLVPPKFIDLGIKSNRLDRSYYVEHDEISLECCTNADANPLPQFTWTKESRPTASSRRQLTQQLIASQQTMLSNENRICNYLKLNLSKSDNDHLYRCSVINDAIKRPITEDFSVLVEYKPEAALHLLNAPETNEKLAILENTSIELYCNATGLPNVISYQWYFNEIRLDDFTNLRSLKLAQLKRHQAGQYMCRASNKHGMSAAKFHIEIIYAQLNALNRTTSDAESQNLREPKAIYINSVENSSVTLNCRLDSNKRQEVLWYYYQLNRQDQVVNKIKLNDFAAITQTGRNGIQKTFSRFMINKLSDRNSGYYACAVRFRLSDDLGGSYLVQENVTYYLQVQYSPIVTAIRTDVYANNYDKIELACEVKSNPQAIISWHFKNKEIQQSYKYTMSKSLLKKFDHSYLDDAENIHSFVSTLTVSSLTHFDYGQYMCRSNNIIGGNSQIVSLHQKQRPEIPTNLRVTERYANSMKLSWLAPPFTGENHTYILSINGTFNLTMADLTSEQSIKQVEIKGLQPEREYTFKIMALNSIGGSGFSDPVGARTTKTELQAAHLPELDLAQFNDIREAICFDLQPKREKLDLTGLVVKIDLNDYMESNRTLIRQSDHPKTYLISLNQLKFGQNCILFPQLVEIDSQRELLKGKPKTDLFSGSYDLLTLNSTHKSSNIYSLKSLNIAGGGQYKPKMSPLGKSFFEFKNTNKLNISICFMNDTQVCTEKLTVNDYTSEFSMYITLIAVGCSAVLILVILLIASICCCYCCARRKQLNTELLKKKTGGSVPLDQNLVIKNFPVLPKGYDYSDDSTKSSQQHILNGSNEICSHSSSSSGSGQNQYYQTSSSKIIDMYDPNVMQNRYYSQHGTANTSSIATVESDISSSGNGSKSSTNHSPYTVMTSDQNTGQFTASMANSSYSAMTNGKVKQSSFIYNNGNVNYIKAMAPYQTATMTQQMKQMHHQFVNAAQNQESPLESSYSTPNTNTNGNSSGTMKKLVYEVIV